MTKRILYIDDEPKIRKIMKLGLEMEGYDVLTAEDGEQGYEVFKRETGEGAGGLSLVLTDIKMPVLDGFGFLKKIRENYPGSPIPTKIMTAAIIFSDKERQEINSSKGFVKKPIKIQDLIEIVEKESLENPVNFIIGD